MRQLRILVTNDDGIGSPGLWDLARAVEPLGSVTVCAPDRDCSGVGPGLTLHQPLRLEQHSSPVPGVAAYAVDGTPGDAAIMGVHRLFDDPPDVVLSGFNPYNNLASDALLSGTVGAALHGYLNGINAVALSVHRPGDSASGLIGEVVRAIMAALLSAESGEPALLNVNFPLLHEDDCGLHAHPLSDGSFRGARLTKLGPRMIGDEIVEERLTNRTFFWNARKQLWRHGDPAPADSDIAAMLSQAISITGLDGRLDDSRAHPVLDAVAAAACAALEA